VVVDQPSDQFITSYKPSPTTNLNFLPQYSQVPVGVHIFIPDQYTHYSIFGSSSFQFTDELKLDVGARYQVFRSHQQSDLSVVAAGSSVLSNFPTISATDAVRTYREFTGGADLTYKITPDDVAYVSYGHSFRPGVAAVGVTAPLAESIILSQGETSDAFELGLKSSWFDNRLNFNADTFYQHFNGYIARTVGNINYSSKANGVIDGSLAMNYNGDAISTGVEAQVDAVITKGWDVGVNTAWVNAQFDNALVPCNLFKGGAATVPVGQQIAYCPTDGRIAEIPKFNLTVQSEYNFDIGEYQPFISGLMTYRPGWHSSIVNYDYQALPILDLHAGVRNEDAGWDFTAFVKNVFDTQRIKSISQADDQQAAAAVLGYTNPANQLGAGTPLDSNYRTGVVTLPREIGVTLRYRFGGSPSEPEAAPAAYTPPPVQAPAPAVAHSYMVFFDFNKSDLTSDAVAIVDQAAKNAGPAKATEITVTGHTDTVGSDAYNMRLSKRRAESVAVQLEKDGIPSSEIAIVAKGKHDLLVPTKDGVKEPQNRRVTIVYGGGPTS